MHFLAYHSALKLYRLHGLRRLAACESATCVTLPCLMCDRWCVGDYPVFEAMFILSLAIAVMCLSRCMYLTSHAPMRLRLCNAPVFQADSNLALSESSGGSAMMRIVSLSARSITDNAHLIAHL